ncbi:MAG: N-acetylglucosamine-6-phosphate deacetylase, partial [Pseudomonadota bacterium]
RAHRRYGTTGFLPTLITDSRARMEQAIAAVDAAITASVPGVLGIHLEGPYINPDRKGIHNPAAIRPMEPDAVALLTSLQHGRTVVTLAPESVPSDALRALVAAGVIVCAGHTNADYAAIREALDQGLRGFTHLFNAMSQLVSREPGVVGAALDDGDSFCGVIVDGWHVHPASLRLALAAKSPAKLMLVTDAMQVTGSDLVEFELHGRRILRSDGRCTAEDGTLAGADLDMEAAVRNAVRLLDVRLEDALRMASTTPAAFLGLDDQLGRLAEGYRANLVLLDDQFAVRECWIDGRDMAQDGLR